MESVNEFEHRLLTAAVSEVWQNPHDDNQFTIKPVRLCDLGGKINAVHTKVGTYTLPTKTERYVVYEFGQSSPLILGIEGRLSNWKRLDEVCIENELLCHVHIKQLQLPLSNVYIMQNGRKNVILAVKVAGVSNLLNTGLPLYFHVYSNDWLTFTAEGRDMDRPIRETSYVISNLTQAADIKAMSLDTSGGNKYIHHNGYLVNDFAISEIEMGDTLAILEDHTGRGYFDVIINDLKHFTSSVDSRGKVILQLPDTLEGGKLTVEMADELEIYVCNNQPALGGQPRIKGFYYSRIQASDVRMLTHRDMSLDSVRLESLIQEHMSDALDMDEPFLRVFLRKNTCGMKTYVDGVHSNDLFRLDAENRIYLMTEVAGVYEDWRPDKLEAAAFVKWQNFPVDNINFSNLHGVYSMSEINSRTRETVVIDGRTTLPYSMTIGGMVLCFDVTGTLMEIISVPANSAFMDIALDEDVYSVECIPGTFTTTGEFMDRDTDFISTADWFDERYYWRETDSTEWHPATEGIDYYINLADGNLIWDNKHNHSGRMRRSLRDAIYRNFQIEPEMLHHPISIYEDPGPASLIPLARLDVFINGKKGAEGIDYVVNYPHITIFNKEYYKDETGMVDIDLFHHGVPLLSERAPHVGFIRHGRLTDHGTDIFLSDRNTSVFVDGQLASLEDLGLPEDPDSRCTSSYREGGVYQAEKWPSTLGPWARKRMVLPDPGIEMKTSVAVSNLISQPVNNEPLFIERGHAIYSPFLKRLLVMIRDETIDVEEFGLSSAGVAMTMRTYLDELDNDIPRLSVDYTLVDIHPTPNITQVDVTEEEMLFLRKVSDIYFHGRVVFNTYLNVQEGVLPHE